MSPVWMRNHQRLPATVIALALAGCLAAGCGGGASPASGTSARPAAAASSAGSTASPSTSSSSPSSSAPAKSGSALEVNHLAATFATNAGGAAALWVAESRGYFQRYGLKVSAQFARGTVGEAALVAGESQVAVTSPADVMAAVAKGEPLVLIATVIATNPYSLVALPSIRSPKDLIGKSIGISKVGDTTDLSAHVALVPYGVIPGKNVTEMQIGSTPARYAALLSGKVAAVLLDGAYTRNAVAKGMHVLISLAQKKVPYAEVGVMANENFVRTHPNTMQAFLKGFLRGAAYFTNPKDRSGSETILGKYMKESPTSAAIAKTYAFYSGAMTCRGAPAVAAVQTLVKGEQEINPTVYGGLSAAKMIDPNVYDALQSSGFISRLCGPGAA